MSDFDLLTPQEMSRQCHCLQAQRRARRLARSYDAALRPAGLTSGQFAILAGLNHPHPVPLATLADILGLERTTLIRNLRPLEEWGLVSSTAGPTGRRARHLVLTANGLAKLHAAMPLWREAQRENEATIPESEPGTSADTRNG